MLKASGVINVQPHKGRMVLDVSQDLVELYYWFIQRKYWIRMNRPMHGAHITLYSQKFNKKINWEKAMYYRGKTIEFDYDENIVEGGYTKGFLMYYLRVYSQELDKIKKKVEVVDGERFKGIHLTIANGKFNSAYPSWPKTIEIREKNATTMTK
jgi:hypothetical protein